MDLSSPHGDTSLGSVDSILFDLTLHHFLPALESTGDYWTAAILRVTCRYLYERLPFPLFVFDGTRKVANIDLLVATLTLSRRATLLNPVYSISNQICEVIEATTSLQTLEASLSADGSDADKCSLKFVESLAMNQSITDLSLDCHDNIADGISVLSKILNMPSLRRLELIGNIWSVKPFERVDFTLGSSLTELNLRKLHLTEVDLACLYQAIQRSSTLCKLQLHSHEYHRKGNEVANLSLALRSNTNLTHLTLDSTSWSKKLILQAMDILDCNANIRHLDLSNFHRNATFVSRCGWHPYQTLQSPLLSGLIKYATHLETLGLPCISSKCLESLLDALQEIPDHAPLLLNTLVLGCDAGDRAGYQPLLSPLFLGLAKLTGLTNLVLKGSGVFFSPSISDMSAFRHFVTICSRIEHLELDGILRASFDIEISRQLSKLPKLRSLHLFGSHLEDGFLSQLLISTSLKSLKLYHCRVDSLDAIEPNRALQELQLVQVTFSEYHVPALNKMLCHCYSLQTLTLLNMFALRSQRTIDALAISMAQLTSLWRVNIDVRRCSKETLYVKSMLKTVSALPCIRKFTMNNVDLRSLCKDRDFMNQVATMKDKEIALVMMGTRYGGYPDEVQFVDTPNKKIGNTCSIC
jgi:hypothetical protein